MNCISAGPITTLASRGIPGFTVCPRACPVAARVWSAHRGAQELAAASRQRAPVQRELGIDDVGAMATFLASDGAALVTGQTCFGARARALCAVSPERARWLHPLLWWRAVDGGYSIVA